MKSVKCKVVGLLAIVSLLAGCGASNLSKNDAQQGIERQVVDTAVYLPTDSFDKEGNLLPYLPRPNPYAEKGGRIKKQSVARYIEARRAFKAKNYASAQANLESLVSEDRSLSGPWVMLGDIALAQEDADKAELHFREAISVNPNNINAKLRLARLLRLKGEYIDAQNVYAEALAIWPDFPEGHLNLAILYDLYMNKPLQAQQHMESYQFLTDGKNEQVKAWLSEIRMRTGVEYSIDAGAKKSVQAAKNEPQLSVAGGAE